MKLILLISVFFISLCGFGFVALLNAQLYERNNTDTYLTSLQIIEKYGYPAEAHVTTSEDGYLLEIHRIPHGRDPGAPRRQVPVYIQHGFLGSSADFLLIGPEKSLPFLLADNGYDVWLGNIRGNTYSRGHKTLTPSDKKFWDFSWHEPAMYDLPAQIDYICNYTKSKDVLYVGYSMGTTMFFVMTSSRPEYQEKIRGAFLMAAVAYLKNTKTPFRVLAPLASEVQTLSEFIADGELIEQSKLYRSLVRLVCTLNNLERRLCTNIIFLYTGSDPYQFNQKNTLGNYLPYNSKKTQKCWKIDPETGYCYIKADRLEDLLQSILNHLPAGSSAKSLTHFAQLIRSGMFRQFDYGNKENMERYNSPEPPEYDLEAINTPLYLFEGPNDFLSTKKDVQSLIKRVPNVKSVDVVNFTYFNHLDFAFGNDVKTLVYDNMIQQMDNLLTETSLFYTSSDPLN